MANRGPVFAGFSPQLFEFLQALETNNNRTWFEANKARYEDEVRGPALDFIADMGPRLEELSPHFLAIPKRTGGSLMRVYRDTRFAKDKTPYKTNVGIQFRHELGKDIHAPGFYVHLEPQEVFIGVGLWRPEPSALAKIRERIAERPDEWRKARDQKSFSGQFSLRGERLTRSPKGHDPEHVHAEDIKRKDFIAICEMEREATLAKDFPQQIMRAFRGAKSFMAFLCRSVEVPF